MICKDCAAWADDTRVPPAWEHGKQLCRTAGCTCQHKPKGAWRGEKHLGAEGR